MRRSHRSSPTRIDGSVNSLETGSGSPLGPIRAAGKGKATLNIELHGLVLGSPDKPNLTKAIERIEYRAAQ
jgi:hypothetical protein